MTTTDTISWKCGENLHNRCSGRLHNGPCDCACHHPTPTTGAEPSPHGDALLSPAPVGGVGERVTSCATEWLRSTLPAPQWRSVRHVALRSPLIERVIDAVAHDIVEDPSVLELDAEGQAVWLDEAARAVMLDVLEIHPAAIATMQAERDCYWSTLRTIFDHTRALVEG